MTQMHISVLSSHELRQRTSCADFQNKPLSFCLLFDTSHNRPKATLKYTQVEILEAVILEKIKCK